MDSSTPRLPYAPAFWKVIDKRLADLLRGDTAGVRIPLRTGFLHEAEPCPACGSLDLWAPKVNPQEIRCRNCQPPESDDAVHQTRTQLTARLEEKKADITDARQDMAPGTAVGSNSGNRNMRRKEEGK